MRMDCRGRVERIRREAAGGGRAKPDGGDAKAAGGGCAKPNGRGEGETKSVLQGALRASIFESEWHDWIVKKAGQQGMARCHEMGDLLGKMEEG